MSKNSHLKELKIKNCKNKMAIRNFSDKKFKVTLTAMGSDPITKDDFHVTFHGGHWRFDIETSQELLDELRTEDLIKEVV